MGGKMKQKLLGSLFAVLLVSTLVYAQTSPPNSAFHLEGKSDFGKIGTTGGVATGNPGYIEVKGVVYDSNATDANSMYYLWVDSTGDVCLASYTQLSTYTSFPDGNWRTGMPCTKVGGQS